MKKNILNLSLIRSLFVALSLMISTLSWAQKVQFISNTDEDLSVQKILIGPVIDNTNSIYSKPLNEELKKLIENDRQWKITVPTNTHINISAPIEQVRTSEEALTETSQEKEKNKGQSASKKKKQKIKTEVASSIGLNNILSKPPEEFVEDPALIKSILNTQKTHGVLALRITKGLSGINLKMWLFVGAEGLPIAIESIENINRFELSDVKVQLKTLFEKVKTRIPYQGILLSRTGNLVTMNYGKIHGAKEGDEINVIQLYKIKRHPKFHFLTEVEQEILGTVRISKVEDSLSFGVITSERKEGLILANSKMISKSFVYYGDAFQDSQKNLVTELNKRPDAEISLGDKPKEWIPVKQPSYGKLGISLGSGAYSYQNSLNTAGPLESSQTLAPVIKFDSELWLNPYWLVGFNLKQSVFNISNPLNGSSPSSINVGLQKNELYLGHNFLIQENFYGPKAQIGFGSFSSKVTVTDSKPLAFTNLNYSGYFFKFGGNFYLSDQTPLEFGMHMKYLLSPKLTEAPYTTGASSSSSINSFIFSFSYKKTAQIRYKGEWEFETLSTQFTGNGTRTDSGTSINNKFTNLSGGLEYLF